MEESTGGGRNKDTQCRDRTYKEMERIKRSMGTDNRRKRGGIGMLKSSCEEKAHGETAA